MKNKNTIQGSFSEMSDKNKYFSVIESLLFVSGEPLKLKDISTIIECSISYTKELLQDFSYIYEEDNRGIKLININDEYQLVTKPQNSDYIEKILRTNVRQSLSQASLEILAIIAYKQPITRVDIDEIRGVKSESAITKLIEKNLIKESGRLEAPGRPILYITTEEFLRQFDIQKISELPSLEGFAIDNIGYAEELEEIASDSVGTSENK
jgi:segregation and condensation protein B